VNNAEIKRLQDVSKSRDGDVGMSRIVTERVATVETDQLM